MISELERAYTRAVEQAAKSVVSVGTTAGPYGPPFGPHARRGHGSGVVFDAQGHILTSHHVISRAERVLVGLTDGRVLSGRVVGADEETDIAVVTVEADGLAPANLGDSDELKVGQPVLAIGNPLGLSGGPTVTSGVISSLRRNLQRHAGDGLRMIQTDAAVNPGNSGGPLIDLEGRVVAINTATIPYAEGIGFAVPVNVAAEVARQILQHGRVPRPWIGIVGYDVDRRVADYYGLPVTKGVLVVEVTEGSPAANAGVRAGDVLVSLGERPVDFLGDLTDALKERRIGEDVGIEVDRNGRRTRLQVTLGTRPF